MLQCLLWVVHIRWFDSRSPGPYNAAFFQNFVRKDDHVVYVSTAVEPQKEARTRLSQTHEHEKRPESLGPSPSQRPRSFDGLDPFTTLHGLREAFSPPCLPQAGTFLSQHVGERSQPSPERRCRAEGTLASLDEPNMSQGGGNQSPFLRTSRDIEYVKQHGRRMSTACFNLLVCKTEAGASRIGIIVGKRFGIAVRRNRAKRLFRELTRHVRAELISGHAVLVFPKRDALGLPFEDLMKAWRAGLRRQGLLSSPEK